MCFPLGPAPSRCTLQGFTQTKHQCAPSPSCGHTGPKSWPATCAHLSCLSPGLCSCCVPCLERSVLTTCTALEAEGLMGKLFGEFREEMRGTGCGRGSGHGRPGWVCDGSGAHPGALHPHPPLPHLCPPTPAPLPPDVSPFLPDSAQIGPPPLGSLTCLQLWCPRAFGLPLAEALSNLCPHGGSWRAAKESPLARIRVYAAQSCKKPPNPGLFKLGPRSGQLNQRTPIGDYWNCWACLMKSSQEARQKP